MQAYNDTILTAQGNGLVPYANATVTVYLGGTTTLASLFSNNGTTVQVNPFQATSLGVVKFYAVDGRYDIRITGTGFATVNLTDVLLEDFRTPATAASISTTVGGFTRTQQAKNNDVVDVLDYGATGLGSLDDAFAFTAAGSIAAKVTVLVPLGTYLITALPAPTGVVIWDIKAGAVFTGANATYFGATTSNDQKTQVKTTGTDFATQYIRRNTSHSGGAFGYVNAGLRVDTYVGINAAAFEWAIIGAIYNSATGGQNVGGYFQGNRVTSGAGPTWGATCEVIEQVPTADPTSGLVGLEVDNRSNGTDANNQRVGCDVVITKQIVGGASTEAGYGYRVQTSRSASVLVKVGYGFDNVNTNVGVAFDASGATISLAAFKMAQGQKISFDASNLNTLQFNGSGLAYQNSGATKLLFKTDGSIVTGTSVDFVIGTTTANKIRFFTNSSATDYGQLSSAGVWSLGGAVGAESLRVTPIASAVNYIDCWGGTIGNGPQFRSAGSDASINMSFVSKGTGAHLFYTGVSSLQQLQIADTPSAVNLHQFTGSSTGNAISWAAAGADTNIGITATPKGTGLFTVSGSAKITNVLNLASYTVATLPTGVQGDTAYVTNALAPAYGVAVAAGGAVVVPVFKNATVWVCA